MLPPPRTGHRRHRWRRRRRCRSSRRDARRRGGRREWFGPPVPGPGDVEHDLTRPHGHSGSAHGHEPVETCAHRASEPFIDHSDGRGRHARHTTSGRVAVRQEGDLRARQWHRLPRHRFPHPSRDLDRQPSQDGRGRFRVVRPRDGRSRGHDARARPATSEMTNVSIGRPAARATPPHLIAER